MKSIQLTILSLGVVLFSLSSYSQTQFNALTQTLLMMEDEMQRMNVVRNDRGNMFHAEVKSELASMRSNESEMKRSKLIFVQQKMEQVDLLTGSIIEFFDDLKRDLILQSGEKNAVQLDKINGQDREKAKPARMDLYKLVEPINKVTISSSDSIKIVERIEDFRTKLMRLMGNYTWGSTEKTYRINDVETIVDYLNSNHLNDLILEQMSCNGATISVDDKYVLIEVYLDLLECQHKATFYQSGALLTNLSILTTLQQRVLSSRDLALANWKSKVSSGEYSFNKIIPLVYGPELANSGETIELVGLMASFDSNNKPKIVVTSHPDAVVTYNGAGQGRIVIENLPIGVNTISGTITIKNKSGIERTKEWEKEILINE